MGGIRDAFPGLDATKSPNDQNSYRVISLSNGIDAVLVSNADEGKQKASCACCVQAGSFSDPARYCEGLAHYCEHMLFLGSGRYPGESEFEEFLSENGGYSNAFTECEYTCFYFEVNRRALHKALDMFAQLFHDPLFTPDSSSRELQAIESEFQKKRNSDGVRTETLFASFAKPDHPWTLFGWGNLQSLEVEPAQKGVSLHDELRKFFREHYKPNRLRLCVFGIEGLDSLQEAVHKSFSVIVPSDNPSQLDFAACGLPLVPEQLPRLVRVRPIKDTHQLSLTWQLPSQLRHYRSKPEQYLSSLIGDEGHGSILSSLKDEGLATELCAGTGGDNFTHSTNSMTFSVEVTLTKHGLQAWPTVAKRVFQYMKMLRGYGGSLPRWPFDEKCLVAQMSFRFQQEKDPCDLVQDISSRMLPLYQHLPEHLLVGPSLYEEFREDLIKALLDELQVSGCFAMLLSSSYGRTSVTGGGSEADDDEEDDSDAEGSSGEQDADLGTSPAPAAPEHVTLPDVATEAKRLRVEVAEAPAVDAVCKDPLFDATAAAKEMKVEPRFGTEYWDTPMDATLVRELEECGLDSRLHVPEPNEFIATDFTILEGAGEVDPLPPRFARTPTIPDFPQPPEPRWPVPRQLTGDGPIWHLVCAERFQQPRSEVWLKVASPYYALDPQNVRKEVMMDMYVNCLRDSLNETLYPASKARLHCHVASASHGFSIKGGGFNQRLLAFIGRVLRDLSLEGYCARALCRFQAQREELLRSYKNAWLKPAAHCAQLRRLLLMPAFCRPVAKERELTLADMQVFREFVGELLAQSSCEIVASGNTAKQELTSWAEGHVASILKLAPQPPVEFSVVRLAPGTATVLMERAVDAMQPNSALEIYWQLPGRDPRLWDEGRMRTRVVLDLLEEVMSEPLFDTLRTKQQLGYTVSCMSRDSHGVLGFSISLLSAVQRPPVLLERVEAFLDEFRQHLRELAPEKFASHAVGLGSRWLEPKRTLSEVQAAAWDEVCTRHPVFDRAEREAAILGTVSKDELVGLFERYIGKGAEARACLVTAVVPHVGPDAKAGPGLEEEAAALCRAFGGSETHAVNWVRGEAQFHAGAEVHPHRGAA